MSRSGEFNKYNEFKDKVVLVTGAGRGIGRAVAVAFAAHQAIVAANDITPINLDQTRVLLAALGGRGRDYVFDVAKKMPVQAMVEQILSDWGRIDILVNNAGVDPQGSLFDMDEWDWLRTMDVNLNGAFFCMQAVGRAMRQQGGGAIVNIATVAGRVPGWRDHAAFVASKMGLIGLTRAAAAEFAAYNIPVNAVCPGMIETERLLLQRESLKTLSERSRPESSDEIPLGRLGHPEEVAEVVLFLCSRAAAYLTGQAINVDGGLVMG